MSVARCAHCGAPLELAEGARRAKCGYCQHDQDVSSLVKAVERPSQQASAGSRYTVGQPVLCEWRGKWWPASIVEVLGDDRVRVEGLNMVKKSQKPNPQAGVAGGLVEREAPLHISNVLLFNPATQKGDRVGFKTLANGKKVRIFKSNKEVVDA